MPQFYLIPFPCIICHLTMISGHQTHFHFFHSQWLKSLQALFYSNKIKTVMGNILHKCSMKTQKRRKNCDLMLSFATGTNVWIWLPMTITAISSY